MGSNRRPKRQGGTVQIPRRRLVSGDDNGARKRTEVASGATASMSMPHHSECRTFGLVRRRVAIERLSTGMQLWGEFNDPAITVHSNDVGLLGNVPSQEAQFFINERDERGVVAP
jgi:hypothetical protein